MLLGDRVLRGSAAQRTPLTSLGEPESRPAVLMFSVLRYERGLEGVLRLDSYCLQCCSHVHGFEVAGIVRGNDFQCVLRQRNGVGWIYDFLIQLTIAVHQAL